MPISCAPETFLALWRRDHFLFLQENERLKLSRNNSSPSVATFIEPKLMIGSLCACRVALSHTSSLCACRVALSHTSSLCACGFESYQFTVCMSCGFESYQFIVCMSCGSESYQFTVIVTRLSAQDSNSIDQGLPTVQSRLHQDCLPHSSTAVLSSAALLVLFSAIVLICHVCV